MNIELPSHIRTQYIETLIRLVELNNDDYWMDAFLKLRSGGYLPGGGAGSLNDWGPSYSGVKADAWFTTLYDIMRYLFDNDRPPEQILNIKAVQNHFKIRVIRCCACNRGYQHPSRLEAQLAVKFYRDSLPGFVREGNLLDILKPSLSFNSDTVLHYRDWLLKQYAGCGITVYDFLFANYICPHCNTIKPATEHDVYTIAKNTRGEWQLVKEDGTWHDLED